METKDLNTAIAYFEEQAELSPFAAQVAKWLTELKDARQKISKIKVFKFEQRDRYRTGAALAIVAAENGDQATKLMCDARDGVVTDIDGYSLTNMDFDAFELTNPIEIPCLQTTLTEPTIIEIVEYNEG